MRKNMSFYFFAFSEFPNYYFCKNKNIRIIVTNVKAIEFYSLCLFFVSGK